MLLNIKLTYLVVSVAQISLLQLAVEVVDLCSILTVVNPESR